ncbi:hypothetical protein GJAV_G00072590 [Gymnothorax javanicus]|nr:hypothetical protein GJAV_G00072590 [Gymnothorax javanicus]
MGVQYTVTKNKNFLYLNIDPSSTSATGKCGQNTTTLSLNFTGGHLEFTFHKEETVSYVTAVRASLEASICKSCQREIFRGVITNKKLFKASAGFCYKCDTETILQLAENLHIKIINAKLQAFDINDRKFGLEEECWLDFNRWAIPIILGGVASGICLIAILTYLIIRENRPEGYERI